MKPSSIVKTLCGKTSSARAVLYPDGSLGVPITKGASLRGVKVLNAGPSGGQGRRLDYDLNVIDLLTETKWENEKLTHPLLGAITTTPWRDDVISATPTKTILTLKKPAIEQLIRASACTSRTDIRTFFTGVYLLLQDGVIRCAATDGYQMAYEEAVDQSLPVDHIFFPAQLLEVLNEDDTFVIQAASHEYIDNCFIGTGKNFIVMWGGVSPPPFASVAKLLDDKDTPFTLDVKSLTKEYASMAKICKLRYKHAPILAFTPDGVFLEDEIDGDAKALINPTKSIEPVYFDPVLFIGVARHLKATSVKVQTTHIQPNLGGAPAKFTFTFKGEEMTTIQMPIHKEV